MAKKPFYYQQVIAAEGDLLTTAAFLMLLVPKNLLSWITGVVVRVRLPKALAIHLLRGFVRLFKIDMSEASSSLEEYASIEDVFVRSLKPGAREVSGEVCSPSDGVLARSQASTGELVQAKGIEYSLSEIVYGEIAGESTSESKSPDLKWFFTVYLAPHNYHRVHAPVAGSLVGVRYLPGQLWPVNLPFVKRIPRLFSRNERLVFDLEVEGGGLVHVVMVGAFNVGRISAKVLPEFVTNALDRQLGARPAYQRLEAPVTVSAGDEIGTFWLGSTVVVAFDEKASERFPVMQSDENTPILMGRNLSK